MKEYHIKHFLNSRNGMTIISADIRDMVSDYLNHYIDSGTETVSNHGMEILKEFMAFISLKFFSMDKNSIEGWNMFLPELKMKFFISVDSVDNTFVAKVGNYEPAENEKTRIMLVKYDTLNRNKTTSHIAIDYKKDIFESLTQYFRETSNEKLVKRGAFYYLLKKTDADDDVFQTVTSELINGDFNFTGFTEMNAASLKFFCGCSHDKIKSMVASVGKETLHELFTADDSIIAECPRCGLKFSFKKKDFKI